MWCFIDESWHEGQREQVGVLAAAVGPQADFEALQREMFRVRAKYYGQENARDLRHELKGKDLFSRKSFEMAGEGYSKNLTIAREILEWTAKSHIRIVGITVYGDKKPLLLAPQAKRLSRPFWELCTRILAHLPRDKKGLLIFDQRIGAQEDISIAVCHYLAGIPEPRHVIPYPFVGVSNVWPGLQLADIVAHILGRFAIGDARFVRWYRMLAGIKAEGLDHHGKQRFGFERLQWAGGEEYLHRKARRK